MAFVVPQYSTYKSGIVIDDYGRVQNPVYGSGTTGSTKTGSGYYGSSVAAGDGFIAVGAPTNGTYGTVTVYNRKTFSADISLTPVGATGGCRFGHSISIGNGKIAVGANLDDPNGFSSGAVYLFNSLGTQLQKFSGLSGGDMFGSSVSLGSKRLAAGAWGRNLNKGAVHIYKQDGTFIKTLDGEAYDDRFGYSVSIGFGRIVVGAYGAGLGGKVYIYDLDGNWLKTLEPENPAADDFGFSVSVGSGIIAVGARARNSQGAVYTYTIDGDLINEVIASDAATNDEFGYSVSVGGGHLVVGARYKDASGTDSGKVYRYTIAGDALISTINGSGSSDQYGYAVASGSHTVVIGSLDNYAYLLQDSSGESSFEDRFQAIGRKS